MFSVAAHSVESRDPTLYKLASEYASAANLPIIGPKNNCVANTMQLNLAPAVEYQSGK